MVRQAHHERNGNGFLNQDTSPLRQYICHRGTEKTSTPPKLQLIREKGVAPDTFLQSSPWHASVDFMIFTSNMKQGKVGFRETKIGFI